MAEKKSPPETLSFDDAVSSPDTVTTAQTINTPGQMLKASGHFLGNLGSNLLQGVGESGIASAYGLGKMILPDKLIGAHPESDAKIQKITTPENSVQSLGKGLNDTAQFFIPGEAEEAAAARLPGLLKFLPRAAGAEVVNEAQGGPVGAGAVGAGLGEGAAAGMKRLAPFAAETAMRIGTKDRAFGKTPGQAILDDTKGIHPATVGQSAQESTDRLMARLEQAAKDASVRPTPPVRGFLMPPVQEIPLAPVPSARNPRMRPMAFDAQVNPEEPMEPRSGGAMAPISEYPAINPHYLSGSEHPELSGRVTPVQNPQQVTTRMGTILRRPEMSASIPPAIEANPVASLRPARDVIAEAQRIASNQNAAGRYAQLGNMGDTLTTHFEHGPIPEQVTPLQLLNLKRGFSDEHLGKWNPDIHEKALAAGRGAYRALDSELDRTVPASAETNQRLSSLIPVLRSADKLERAPSFFQRTAGRVAAHTGALTGAGIGAVTGYREGGAGGALAGGAAGLLLPEIVASPEAQMAMARTLGSKTLQKAATPLAAAGTSKMAKLIRDLRETR